MSVASFITQSVYPVALSRMHMFLKSVLCSVSDLCSVMAGFPRAARLRSKRCSRGTSVPQKL